MRHPTRHPRKGSPLKWFGALALLCSFNLSATTVIPPDLTDLVKESDYVIRAVVSSVTTHEKTVSGHRPLIYSSVTLDISEVIIGTPPNPCVLEVLGGKFAGREMYISGVPQFTVGEEAIFFVQGNQTQIYPLARMMHGLYPILKEADSNREYVARSDGEAMADVQQISEPMHGTKTAMAASSTAAKQALTPEDFASQIRATARSLEANEK